MNEKYHLFEDNIACVFGTQDMRGHRFIQCTFDHAEFTKKENYANQLHGAVFYGCSFRSIEAQGYKFDHVTFRDCDFMHANLRETEWYRTQAFKCEFVWADFEGADTKGLFGESSDFKLSNIHKASRINVLDRDMISELIRVGAKGDYEILMIASLVKNSMEFCWKEWNVIAHMPQWKGVAKKCYDVLKQYPHIIKAIDAELIGG